jgi:hypothetical protein
MTVNTRRAERREVRLESLDDLRAEVERLAAAERAGTLRRTGNWSAGQAFEHLGKFMAMSIDGFPPEAAPPWWIRGVVKLVKPRAVRGMPPPAGLKLPAEASFLLPRDSVPLEEGEGLILRQIERVRAGERFEKPSPAFGALSHEQWTRLHLGHARLHLSFLHA